MAFGKKLGVKMPIDKEELKRRKWPLPAFPIGSEIKGRKKEKPGVIFYDDAGARVIAREGKVYAYLPHPDDYGYRVREEKVRAIALPIPPEECGITSLVNGRGNRIFGSTCGRSAHLFMCNSDKKAARGIIDLGKVDVDIQKSSLVIHSDGRLFLGTKPASGEGYIYSYNTKSASSKIEKICCPVKGEGISALSIDNDLSRIYGLSSKSGTFFIFYIDKGSLKLKGIVDKDSLFSETLVVVSNGDVFGGCRWTHFFKYDIEKDALISLKIKAPSICGKEMYNKIESLIFDKESQSIYGGTSGDGILFRLYPKQGKIISLGKPLNQPHIRSLAIGKDNRIYGVAGKACCHLFRYNPEEGDLQDLGILHISSPRYWHGYEFDAMVVGEKGEIYIGQNERISCLFTYFPSL